jgi:hypothetical protein
MVKLRLPPGSSPDRVCWSQQPPFPCWLMSDNSYLNGRINLTRAAILLLSGYTGMNSLSQMFDGFGVKHPYRTDKPQRAMDICREADLDLIICDGDLPGGASYDFIAELRRSDLEPNRYAPVIVVAGTRLWTK